VPASSSKALGVLSESGVVIVTLTASSNQPLMYKSFDIATST
jgi:hypothetical protein